MIIIIIIIIIIKGVAQVTSVIRVIRARPLERVVVESKTSDFFFADGLVGPAASGVEKAGFAEVHPGGGDAQGAVLRWRGWGDNLW